MAVEPLPCAPEGGGGTPVEVTTCCAPSIASTPLCRQDGTTVLLVVRSGCAECGTTAGDPEVAGWLDATGTFTPGPAPADAAPCDAGCVDTVCRTRCDDTDGDGAPDTTYTELWCIRATGAAELVLTYQDDPSQEYVPASPVECEYGCQETETLTLCDDVGPFLRRYTWLQGVATFEDWELDGVTPHVVTGPVTTCAGTSTVPEECAERTTPATTLGLCLPDGTPLAVIVTRDCDGTTTQDGWLNLLTGTYTSGPPPAGAAACGDARAFELAGLLCDVDPATGDVLGLVLVEYEYNQDGSLAGVRLVDPGTGTTYTLQGELRRCPTDGPQLPDQDLTVLCDTAADGTRTPFVRDYRRDPATGQITGLTDYTLDGQPYTVTGTPGLCQPEPEPCRDVSTTLVCDLPAGEATGAPTATDTSATPYPWDTDPIRCVNQHPGGGAALWAGGTVTIPARSSATGGCTPNQWLAGVAATLQAPRPSCDSGTVTITVAVAARNNGPSAAAANYAGSLRLHRTDTGARLADSGNSLGSTPAGAVRTLTATAMNVPAALLAAGQIAVVLDVESWDQTGNTGSAWLLSDFTAAFEFQQDGCETQFLRRIVTDCESGTVLAVTDTTLDGQPYTVTGQVGQCQTAGGGECCPPPPPEPCRNTSAVLLCDLPQGGTPEPTVTDTSPVPYTTLPGVEPVAGGAAAVWSGGTLTIPADTTGAADGSAQRARAFASTIRAPRPGCDTGTATVTATLTVERTGPDAACLGSGYLWLLSNGTRVATAAPTASAPVGTVDVLTVTAQVPAADLAAGNVVLTGALETHQAAGSSCLNGSGPGGARIGGWNLRDFAATVAYDQTGCERQILRTVTVDCETGAVIATADTTLDGQPYTVTGQVGQCATAGGGECCPPPEPEPCPAQTVIEACRCDDTDGDGAADTDYVELLGVDCAGTVTSLGTYLPDLSAPYTPVAPVSCSDTSEGAPPAFGVQAGRVQLEAGASWNASTVAALQSVTATAHTSTGEITTSDGTSTLFQGESVTWSTQKEGDALLAGPLTITAVGGIVTVTYTRGVTL